MGDCALSLLAGRRIAHRLGGQMDGELGQALLLGAPVGLCDRSPSWWSPLAQRRVRPGCSRSMRSAASRPPCCSPVPRPRPLPSPGRSTTWAGAQTRTEKSPDTPAWGSCTAGRAPLRPELGFARPPVVCPGAGRPRRGRRRTLCRGSLRSPRRREGSRTLLGTVSDPVAGCQGYFGGLVVKLGAGNQSISSTGYLMRTGEKTAGKD